MLESQINQLKELIKYMIKIIEITKQDA